MNFGELKNLKNIKQVKVQVILYGTIPPVCSVFLFRDLFWFDN